MSRRTFGGRTVLVTGAAGGLGAALVERFGRAGARIGALDVREDALLAATAIWSGEGLAVEAAVADATDPAQVAAAVGKVESQLGPVHTVINNAGITHVQAFDASQMPQIRRVMEVNFLGAVQVTAACFDSVVRQRGLFITISSVAGFAPLLGRTGYCASKHALHGFFETLRLELRDTGTSVLLVCPSYIATGIRKHLGHEARRAGVRDEATPQAVADQIYRAAVRDRRLLAVGRVGRVSRWLRRWWPGLFDRLMIRSVASTSTTGTSTTRTW